MSWRQQNKMKQEEENKEDTTIYTIGTMIAGTDRSLEDSLSGYVPIMIDRRGNRRFHGAFTGGFSAGYFNTVSSAQGYKAKYDSWTSSRNKKSKQNISQTPMDFMDDEDMATNTNLLTTAKQFNSLSNDSLDAFNKNKASISHQFGDTMSNYLSIDKNAVFNHTKGIQLLKKCGWRTGKNIGDKSNMMRLKLLLKKQDQLLLNNNNNNNNNNSLLFGDHILKTEDNDNDNDNVKDNENKMVSIYRPKQKKDLHGIGYDADNEDNDELQERSDSNKSTLSGHKRSSMDENDRFCPLKKKRKIFGPSIGSIRHGLSALEEVEIGDDVYGDDIDEHIEYNTFITHIDDNDNDNDKRKLIRDRNRNYNDRKKELKKKKKKDERVRSRDGRLPIDGFVVSSIPENYQYSLKQQIGSNNNYNRNRNNYHDSDFNGYKHFKSNKMEIDNEFIDKFANIDLTVGSFLCRNGSNIRNIRSNILNDLSSSIPESIPDIQQSIDIEKEKKNLSQHLHHNFTAGETMTSHEKMGGLNAGLTLSSHIPSKMSKIHKTEELLNDIRNIFGNDNAEKLLRFDVFLANKLDIESPIDTQNSLLMDDGNKTQFQLNQEINEFEEKWDILQEYKEYIYPNKPRLHRKITTMNDNDNDMIKAKKKKISLNMTAQQAAEQNMYGELTRSVEMWIPDRLLCKRCNIRDPYQGMYGDKMNQFKSHLDERTEKLFGGLLINNNNNNNKGNNKKYKRRNTVNIVDGNTMIKSKGEQIAEILEMNESNQEPPILQLKQLKTWNSYLLETDYKKNKNQKDIEENNKVNKEEMKSFIDGILNDSDSEDMDDDDNNDEDDNGDDMNDVDKDIKKGEMSLFKSIFENNESSDSESEESEESESIQSEIETNKSDVITTSSLQIESNPVIQTKKNVILHEIENNKNDDNDNDNDEEEEEEDIVIPRQRKKFKFVTKSNRDSCNALMTGFGSIGVIEKRKSISKNIDIHHNGKQEIEEIQLEYDSDDDVDQNVIEEDIKPRKDEMVWAVIDNESTDSNDSDDDDDERRRKSRKKRKNKKGKEKKSKKKKSKHKSKSKSRSKNRNKHRKKDKYKY